MSWQQVKAPNLNTPARLGWCLEYVQNAFGSGNAGEYALQGWNLNTAFNHQDRKIPAGVYVPIWFDGYWTGIRYGHVAIYKDGIVYSSPWTKESADAHRHDVLGSIEDVERIYRMTYLGWSEGLGGTRVVKQVKEKSVAIIQNAENWYGRCNDTHWRIRGRELSRATFKGFVGKDFLTFVETCSDDKEAQVVQKWQELGKKATKDNWEGQINSLKKQVSDLKGRPTKAQLDAANAAVAKLQKDMAAANVVADKAEAKAADVATKLETIELETAQAKREADNFLTALINAVRSMFGGKS